MVPDVKLIMSGSSFFVILFSASNLGACSMPWWKSNQASGTIGPTEIHISTVGDSGMESLMCCIISVSPTDTIALIEAALLR